MVTVVTPSDPTVTAVKRVIGVAGDRIRTPRGKQHSLFLMVNDSVTFFCRIRGIRWSRVMRGLRGLTVRACISRVFLLGLPILTVLVVSPITRRPSVRPMPDAS
jgi:hypothetical protein